MLAPLFICPSHGLCRSAAAQKQIDSVFARSVCWCRCRSLTSTSISLHRRLRRSIALSTFHLLSIRRSLISSSGSSLHPSAVDLLIRVVSASLQSRVPSSLDRLSSICPVQDPLAEAVRSAGVWKDGTPSEQGHVLLDPWESLPGAGQSQSGYHRQKCVRVSRSSPVVQIWLHHRIHP